MINIRKPTNTMNNSTKICYACHILKELRQLAKRQFINAFDQRDIRTIVTLNDFFSNHITS